MLEVNIIQVDWRWLDPWLSIIIMIALVHVKHVFDLIRFDWPTQSPKMSCMFQDGNFSHVLSDNHVSPMSKDALAAEKQHLAEASNGCGEDFWWMEWQILDGSGWYFGDVVGYLRWPWQVYVMICHLCCLTSFKRYSRSLHWRCIIFGVWSPWPWWFPPSSHQSQAICGSITLS